MQNKILKIGTTPTTRNYVSFPWVSIDIFDNIKAAQLATIVISKNDKKAIEKVEQIKAESRLNIPVIVINSKENLSQAEIKEKILKTAQTYEDQNVPAFLRDLINFANDHPVSYTTPGHHNGQFYDCHPAGIVFKEFFGNNMLRADVSDTVAELGDTLTHGGTPLDSEREAARVFNADKVYYTTNGTTSSNTICASAVLSEGDLVLFDRNNHKSLYNSALIMSGAKPIYIRTSRNPLGLIGPIVTNELNEEKIREQISSIDPKKAREKRPFRMAVLQLETFDGVFYNARWLLDKIGHLCDYVLFDCAWGGYEQFVEVMKELSPLQYQYTKQSPGILVTQSIHKQQAGLAQTSQILKKDAHIKGQKRYVDHKHFNNAYLKYVTTSYSYPLYASLTVNSALVKGEAAKFWWNEAMKKGINFRKELKKRSKLFKTFNSLEVWQEKELNSMKSLLNWKLIKKNNWHGFEGIDDNEAIISPLKLTVVCPGVDVKTGKYTEKGIPGKIVGEYLTEKRIIACKSDLYSNLFLLTPGESNEALNSLLVALLEFEQYYQEDAPIKDVLPRLYEQHSERYQGYTIRKLCQEMHNYYAKNEIYKLQQKLFLKEDFQSYEMTPAQADKLFMKNKGELVDIDKIVGRVALEGALPYPPGVFVVAPGEKWHQIDVDYFKILLGAIDEFPGFDPEIQGVYLNKMNGKTQAKGFVL